MYSATAPEHTGQRGSPPGEPANHPEPRSSPRSGQASLLRTVKVAQAPAPETPICSSELTRARTLITVQNGGSARGYQAIFVPSTALASPGYDGQPQSYIYTLPRLR
jgi:hypothetical protein